MRLKDSTTGFSHAIVTIAGESFLAQYELLPGGPAGAVTVNIEPADTRPLDISGVELTGNQLRAMALDIISRKAHG
ncbi:hypothetical protein KQH22_31165, partial [Streptomyces sp. Vc714c-19]|uniref:hypothetical protein n=1 Tax=Streptomyces sp. Vc714c-19 TaxID=2841673 RepID=UPI002095DB92